MGYLSVFDLIYSLFKSQAIFISTIVSAILMSKNIYDKIENTGSKVLKVQQISFGGGTFGKCKL